MSDSEYLSDEQWPNWFKCQARTQTYEKCYDVYVSDTMRKASDRPAAPKDLADWLLARGQHWVTTA